MASGVLRQFVYARFTASSVLASLKLTEAVIFPNWAPDAVDADMFLVMRWGITSRGYGRVNHCDLGCWVYNRQPDYGPIADALAEIKIILPTMIANKMNANEAILGVGYNGDSDDLYDDGYRAYTRWTSHTITASGS